MGYERLPVVAKVLKRAAACPSGDRYPHAKGHGCIEPCSAGYEIPCRLPDKVCLRYLKGDPVYSLLRFAKASTSSKVCHRPAYPDTCPSRRWGAKGKVLTEHRFMGLYTHGCIRSGLTISPWRRQVGSGTARPSGFTAPQPCWARAGAGVAGAAAR